MTVSSEAKAIIDASSLNEVSTVSNLPSTPASLPVANFSGMTMSSKQIAEITGKEHNRVIKDIRVLTQKSELTFEQKQWFTENKAIVNGRTICTHYDIGYKGVMLLITGYSPEKRAAVLDRLEALETGAAAPAYQAAQQQPPVIQQVNVQELATAVAIAVVSALRSVDSSTQRIEVKREVVDLDSELQDSFSITAIAMVSGISHAELYNLLIKRGHIIRVGYSSWQPANIKISSKYCIKKPGSVWAFSAAGKAWIQQHLGSLKA